MEEVQASTIKSTITGDHTDESTAARFHRLTPYERKQLTELDVKTFEVSVLILDGEHVNLKSRKARLKEHVWKLSRDTRQGGPSKQQEFMKQWSVRSRVATSTNANDELAGDAATVAKANDPVDRLHKDSSELTTFQHEVPQCSEQSNSTDGVGDAVSVPVGQNDFTVELASMRGKHDVQQPTTPIQHLTQLSGEGEVASA